jgi:hypothetical protein
MAEPVAALLRRSLDHLAAEVPESYRRLLGELGPLVVGLDVDGELFSLRGGGGLKVSDGLDGAAGAWVATSRAAILDVLDAEESLSEAVEAGRILVHGSLDAVVRGHDALMAYVHAAVRAPSATGLLTALREGAVGR